jgi:hypothetical protein
MHKYPNAMLDYVAIKVIAMIQMLQVLSITMFHYMAITMIIGTT